jgi:1-acyl-sn-glycerol-3-phosphate acyltransferase
VKDFSYKPAADTMLKPGERFRSTRREAGLISVSINAGATLGIRAYLRLYHRMRVVGRENLPRTLPFVLIANHGSHLDTLVLTSALPLKARIETCPVAAGDVFFKNSATSLLASLLLNALPLYRKGVTSHALEDLRERVTSGHGGLVLFPEGTRTRDGAMGPFKAGLGMIVAGTSVPVMPCYLEGPFRAFPAGTRVPRPVRITLRVGSALRFDTEPNDRDGWTNVARRSEAAVRALAP